MILLVIFVYVAGKWGVADLYAKQSRYEVSQWEKKNQQPTLEEWKTARSEMQAALDLEPANPSWMEEMGRTYLWKVHRFQRKAVGAEVFQEQALEYFRAAAKRRPASPYTWSNIALVKFDLGQLDREFLHALKQSVWLGPWEPEVQLTVADVGLAAWLTLPDDVKKLVQDNVQRGMKRHADAMLRLARTHKRWDVVCFAEVRRELVTPAPCG